jgi:hypothetical protein
MSVFLEKLTKSRQTVVEAGGKNFTITRPTPMQAMDWLVNAVGDPLSHDEVKQFITDQFSLHNTAWRNLAQTAIEKFVVDWPGMQELDIIPGGIGAPISFDRDLFLLWVQDHPSTITNLGYRIFKTWVDYLEAQQAAEKKPENGTSQEA